MKGMLFGMSCRKSVTAALLLILADLALADLSVTPSDITVARGQSVLLMCTPRDINVDKGIVWSGYFEDPMPRTQKFFTVIPGAQKELVYVDGVDQNKFVRNGTYNLLIRNVQLADGAVYGCSPITGNPQYANLVVIGDFSVATNPSQNIAVGSMLTITCSLSYSGPNETNAYKPLSSGQDPNLRILVAGRDLQAAVYKQPGGIKTAVVNTTVTQDFVGADIVCELTSTTQTGTPYTDRRITTISVPTPPKDMTFFYNSNSSDGSDLRVGDSVNCTAKGYPLPTVRWAAISPSNLKNPSSSTWGPGWALLTFDLARNGQVWNCTASNNATVGIQLYQTKTFNVKTITGQSVTGGAISALVGGTFIYVIAVASILAPSLLDRSSSL